MTHARDLQPLPVPSGTGAPDALPALRRALDGEGPALLPVPEDEPEQARRVAEALRVGEPLAPATEPAALVIATSGSTGTPKGVLLTTSALRASAAATHERLGGPGTWLLAMPAHHVAGIQVLVRALLAGTEPHAVDTSDGFRPEAFAAAARRALATSGQHYTALVPTQLSRLVQHENGLDALREFDAVLLGGAATPPALLEHARQAGVRAVTTYGMSETAGGCVYDGVPLAGVDVRVDAGDQQAADQQAADQQAGDQQAADQQAANQRTGAIRISGPVLASGYRGAGSDAFRDGWFRTGDLGRWDGGSLRVLGRLDDVIVTGGVNVAPAPVERILGEQESVREACVFGAEDPEWGEAVVAAVVPADPTAPPSAEDLRSAVRARASAAETPRRVLLLDELPVRGPGKPDRRALREALDD